MDGFPIFMSALLAIAGLITGVTWYAWVKHAYRLYDLSYPDPRRIDGEELSKKVNRIKPLLAFTVLAWATAFMILLVSLLIWVFALIASG